MFSDKYVLVIFVRNLGVCTYSGVLPWDLHYFVVIICHVRIVGRKCVSLCLSLHGAVSGVIFAMFRASLQFCMSCVKNVNSLRIQCSTRIIPASSISPLFLHSYVFLFKILKHILSIV